MATLKVIRIVSNQTRLPKIKAALTGEHFSFTESSFNDKRKLTLLRLKEVPAKVNQVISLCTAAAADADDDSFNGGVKK